MNALAQAVHERRWQQAKLLIDIGCSVNGKGDNGRTPLIEMCFVDDQKKAAALTRVLLEKGADIGARDDDGRTALSNACLLHRTKLFPLLIKFVDFDLNSADNDGNTALFHAITAGDVWIVKELLAKVLHFGLKVDLLNKKGETPLIYALKSKKLDIAEVLINDGKASLEVRDLEFQKSASQWKEEVAMETNVSSNFLPLLIIKSSSVGKRKSQLESQTTKTSSAKPYKERSNVLPILPARPATAPDRIVVPDLLRPCVPIKTSLAKLYMIYNQQTTGSFRYGYKPVKYKALKRDQMQDQRPSKFGVSFNQVNELTMKLQGLYKDSVKRKRMDSGSSKGQWSRGDSGERPRSIAKGAKALTGLTKSAQQFEASTKNKKDTDAPG